MYGESEEQDLYAGKTPVPDIAGRDLTVQGAPSPMAWEPAALEEVMVSQRDPGMGEPPATLTDAASGKGSNPFAGFEWDAGRGQFVRVEPLWREDDPPAPGVNPKDLIGDTKAPLHLVPPALLISAAEALSNGAAKYGPYNWRDYPIQAHAYYAAVLRHLTAWWDGEDDSADAGISHLAHAVAGLAILLDSIGLGTLVDDRPKAGPAAALLERQAS